MIHPRPTNPDRYGFARCAGYTQAGFHYCSLCPRGDGLLPKPECPECGGYGEVAITQALAQ